MRGREPPLGVATPSLLAVAAARAIDARVFVTLRIGMREGVPVSSVSNIKCYIVFIHLFHIFHCIMIQNTSLLGMLNQFIKSKLLFYFIL